MKYFLFYIILSINLAPVVCKSSHDKKLEDRIYNNWKELDSTVVFKKLSEKYWGHSPKLGYANRNDSVIESYSYWIDSSVTSMAGGLNSSYYRVSIDCFKYTNYARANEAMEKFSRNLVSISKSPGKKDPYGPDIKAYPVYYLLTNRTIYQLSGDYTSVEEIDGVFNTLVSIVSDSKMPERGSVTVLKSDGTVELR